MPRVSGASSYFFSTQTFVFPFSPPVDEHFSKAQTKSNDPMVYTSNDDNVHNEHNTEVQSTNVVEQFQLFS